jgi:hypothetical protein
MMIYYTWKAASTVLNAFKYRVSEWSLWYLKIKTSGLFAIKLGYLSNKITIPDQDQRQISTLIDFLVP